MNQRSDIDRTLEIWLADGPTTISDHVVDVVAGRIARQRQRRSWPLLRRLQMNTYTKLAAAAVIAAIAVGAIYLNLPNRNGVGGVTPSPSATPSPNPTPTQTPTPTLGSGPLPEGKLAAGHYTMTPIVELPSLTLAADIPAGWKGYAGVPALASPGSADAVFIAFMVTDGLFSDPCHWDLNGTGLDQPGDVVVGPTVDDLVSALKANASYPSTAATPVTFGQFEGQELELQLPGDDVLLTCDMHGAGSPFTGVAYFVFPHGFYAQGPNSRWHLYIVDVNGTRLITMISILEGAPPADIAAAEAIVQSFDFTP